MNKKVLIFLIIPLVLIFVVIMFKKASQTLPWPSSPLYQPPAGNPTWKPSSDKAVIMQQIVGHYAHYDIVSYEDMTTSSPMRTFIISYGFTDFFIREGKLFQSDRFVHAEQKLNQKNTTSRLSDKAVQAIDARITEVSLSYTNGTWYLFRPPSPVLLGINGDPGLPLSQDPADPQLTDPDEDGFPGVTVSLDIGGVLKGDIYITRKEVYQNHLKIISPDLMQGYVVDSSEQFVAGATLSFLNRPSHNKQHPDPGMNPIILRRVDPSVDTWEELQTIRDDLFPAEPSFY